MTKEKDQSSTLVSKVLLLGCGDIGGRLAPQLQANNCVVTGARRRQVDDCPAIRYQQVDAKDKEQLALLLQQGWDIIVITLTPSRYDDEGYRQGYVEPIQNLIASLQCEPPPGLIIFVSSTGVYGQNDGSEVDEYSQTVPQRFNGKRVLQAEKLLRDSNFNTVTVRFSGIYGPGRERLINLAREQKWTETDKAQCTNRIHVDDCAGILAHLIDQYKSGKALAPTYLGSDSEPVSSWNIKHWLAHEQSVINEINVSTYFGFMTNKKCSNQKILASGYEFQYPTYREGYRAVLAAKE